MTRRQTIDLWDIGFSTNSVIPPLLVAREQFKEHQVVIIDLQPIAAGDGLLVMLEVTPYNSAIEYFRAFGVFPSAPIPEFHLVGSLSFENTCLPISVGDLFVFLSDGNATVWNPVQDSWARWHIGIVGESLRDVQCVKCEDNLLFMSDNELTVWKIPQLVDRSIDPDPIFDLTPIVHQVHQEQDQHYGSLLAPPIGWNTISSKMHFDILYSENDGQTALEHRVLHPVDDDVDESSPILDFIGQTPSVTPSYQATDYVKSAWMSPSESVYFWAENSKFVAILSTLGSSKKVSNQRSVGILWESDSEQKLDAAVCPFSGRVCLLNRPRRNKPGSVQIMSYV